MCQLSWNSFHIHFFITTTPDIVTGWHILCLTYFSSSVLIKQKTRDLQIPDVITSTSSRVQYRSLHPCRVNIWLYHWPEVSDLSRAYPDLLAKD